jgi:hypothetical protein
MSTDSPTVWYNDSTENSTGTEAGWLVFWSVSACLLTLVNRFAGYLIHIPSYGSSIGHLFALLYLALLLLALLHTARSAARLPISTPVLLISGVLLAIPMGAVLLMQQFRLFPDFFLSQTANNLFLPVAAALVGAAVGRIIKHPNTLLAAAGFSLFFDIVVVTMGTVAQLMRTGNSAIIAAVSVGAGAAPVQGSPMSHMHLPEPISGVTIGPADVLFLALFQSAVHQMNLSRRATFGWMFALLFTALVVVELFGLPIPALAPMGIAVLIANMRHGAFTKQEKRDLVIGAVFALFCATLMIGGARFFIKPSQAVEPDFKIQLLGPVGPVIIGEVKKNSAADLAGLRAGDKVESFNGKDPMKMVGADFAEAWAHARKDGIRLRVQHLSQGPSLDILVHYDRVPQDDGASQNSSPPTSGQDGKSPWMPTP